MNIIIIQQQKAFFKLYFLISEYSDKLFLKTGKCEIIAINDV